MLKCVRRIMKGRNISTLRHLVQIWTAKMWVIENAQLSPGPHEPYRKSKRPHYFWLFEIGLWFSKGGQEIFKKDWDVFEFVFKLVLMNATHVSGLTLMQWACSNLVIQIVGPKSSFKIYITKAYISIWISEIWVAFVKAVGITWIILWTADNPSATTGLA